MRWTDSSWPAKCIARFGTGRRVLEQEKQVTNWMNSGGHVPRPYAENSNLETTGRHRAGRWKRPLIVGGMLLMLPLAADPGEARDPDGRYANSPLKQWFDSLREREGTVLFRRGRQRCQRCRLGIRQAGTTAFASTASGTTCPTTP